MKDASKIEDALYDGEDYELLFTINARDAERLLKKNFSKFATRISLIGEINGKREGYNILEVPSHERIRAGGKAKSSVVIHGTKFLLKMIAEGFKFHNSKNKKNKKV